MNDMASVLIYWFYGRHCRAVKRHEQSLVICSEGCRSRISNAPAGQGLHGMSRSGYRSSLNPVQRERWAMQAMREGRLRDLAWCPAGSVSARAAGTSDRRLGPDARDASARGLEVAGPSLCRKVLIRAGGALEAWLTLGACLPQGRSACGKLCPFLLLCATVTCHASARIVCL